MTYGSGSCSDPNCAAPHSRAERHSKIRADIKRVGWTVLGVLGTPSIAYTIGMTERRWPELVFTLDVPGTPKTLRQAQQLLNAVGKKLVDSGERPHHGQVVTLLDDDGREWKCLLEVRMNTTGLVQAKDFYPRRLSAMEVELVD